jgi:Spy/CpxP family protein refolding chaperone
MKNSLLKYILILSLLLNFSLLGTAGYNYYHVHHQSHFPLTAPVGCGIQDNHLFAALSLKPEQIKPFQQKAASFHEALGKKRQEVERLREGLFGYIRTDNPDSQAIQGTIIQINKTQENMQRLVVAHMLEFKSLLDKNQQKKFLDLIEGAMAKRKEALCP